MLRDKDRNKIQEDYANSFCYESLAYVKEVVVPFVTSQKKLQSLFLVQLPDLLNTISS